MSEIQVIAAIHLHLSYHSCSGQPLCRYIRINRLQIPNFEMQMISIEQNYEFEIWCHFNRLQEMKKSKTFEFNFEF